MKRKKVKISFDFETGGLEKGKHFILASGGLGKSAPIFPILDVQEYLKKHGIKDASVTKYEKIGDTVYPVTYGPNGIVTIDYPTMDLFKIKKEQDEKNGTGSTNK